MIRYCTRTVLRTIFFKTCEYIYLVGSHGIILNREKFQFCQKEVEYVGFKITEHGVKPSEETLRAIRDFPKPKNISGVRSFFGLIEQVSFAFSKTEVMAPFRQLLSPKTPFKWDSELDEAFERGKQEIIEKVITGIQLFDLNRTTCLQVDWSKEGIGFLLLQRYCQCSDTTPRCCPDGWKLCYVNSRFLSDVESRYAPIEGELLAVAWSLRKTRHWVLGCPGLIVATDHKPLIGLFEKELGDIDNPHLRILMEKTLPFQFVTIHLPGIENKGADATSRYPVNEAEITEIKFTGRSFLRHSYQQLSGEDILESYLVEERALQLASVSIAEEVCSVMIDWNEVATETGRCEELGKLIKTLRMGSGCYEGIEQYKKYKERLIEEGGVVKCEESLLIPKSLRRKVLDILHQGHAGCTGMRLRAKGNVWWPGLHSDIELKRKECWTCTVNAPSLPAEPPVEIVSPEYPMQKLVADYFELEGFNYLVIVDRYSNWPMVFRVKAGDGSRELCKLLRQHFSIFGCPDELTSDRGPQFTSEETSKFLRDWKVCHRVSSAYFPHANLRAEQGVKTVKRILRGNLGERGSLDCDQVARALLNYRNTPDRDLGRSPAQIVFGRPVKDTMPMEKGRFKPSAEWLLQLDERERLLGSRHARAGMKWKEHTRVLQELEVGTRVQIQNQTGPREKKWDRSGIIVEYRGNRQYLVRLDGSGRLSLRNRRFLKPICTTRFRKPSDGSEQLVRSYPRRVRRIPDRFSPGERR